MMIFRDWRVWFIDNFMKMPQLNRKYQSGAGKRRKTEESIKLMKNVKVSWTHLLLLLQVVLVSPQWRVQLQAPELLIAAMSVHCSYVQPK